MVAISDVARLAGVSKSTASRALSGSGYVSSETRERVVRAAEELGFVASPIAAGLATGKTRNIAVAIPFVSRWFFGNVLEGIEESLLGMGYDMTLYNVEPAADDRDRVFDFFLARKRFDGVIAVGIEPDERELDRLTALQLPIVGVGNAVGAFPSYAIDDVREGARATEHLIALGHSRIAHVGGTYAERLPQSVHGKRLAGYRDAMAAAGLEASAQFVQTSMTMPGGYEAGIRLLGDARGHPTAVFAACDEVAVGVIIAARRLGMSVPADLSVIGIDGHEYAEMFSLTTIEQEPKHQGAAAVSALLAALAGKPEEPGVRPVATRLVLRSSTTRPRS